MRTVFSPNCERIDGLAGVSALRTRQYELRTDRHLGYCPHCGQFGSECERVADSAALSALRTAWVRLARDQRQRLSGRRYRLGGFGVTTVWTTLRQHFTSITLRQAQDKAQYKRQAQHRVQGRLWQRMWALTVQRFRGKITSSNYDYAKQYRSSDWAAARGLPTLGFSKQWTVNSDQ